MSKGAKRCWRYLQAIELPPGTSAEVQEELRKLIGYFENNRHRTDYPSYRQQRLGHRQWSDGSGLQDHRRTPERFGHALGRGRCGHGGCAACACTSAAANSGTASGPNPTAPPRESHPSKRCTPGAGGRSREPSRHIPVFLVPGAAPSREAPRSPPGRSAHTPPHPDTASWCRSGMPSRRHTSGKVVGRAIGPAVPTGFILQARPLHSDANSRNPLKVQTCQLAQLTGAAGAVRCGRPGRAAKARLIGTSKASPTEGTDAPCHFAPAVIRGQPSASVYHPFPLYSPAQTPLPRGTLAFRPAFPQYRGASWPNVHPPRSARKQKPVRGTGTLALWRTARKPLCTNGLRCAIRRAIWRITAADWCRWESGAADGG